MPTRSRRVCIAALVLVAVAPPLPGQSSHGLPVSLAAPVPGAPMSAVRTLDYEPAAGSSDPTPVHAEEKMYRDSQGRLREELAYTGRPSSIHIIDWVSHTHYWWVEGSTTVSQAPLKDAANAARPTEVLDADAPQIEGVPTRHSQNIRKDNAGIQETIESWYSPDLRLALVTVVDKEGVGKTTYRYQHIQRAEPDAALFRLPAGATISDPKKQPPPPLVSTVPMPLPGSSPSQSQQPPQTLQQRPAPAYESDPKFQKAMEDAKDRRLTTEESLMIWKKAVKLSENQCVECLRRVIQLQMNLEEWKDAVNTANSLEAAATEPRDKFFAESERGAALLHTNNDNPKPEQLKEAEASLSAALTISPRTKQVVYAEGRALALMGRFDDAKAMYQKYVDITNDGDHLHLRAEHFIENPKLAALPMAPPFKLVTSEGEELNLDDMNGKVVLLDFWATWCGPCKETLPEIARVAKDFQGEPLVVISISGDQDAAAWRAFIAKNNMTWPQYRDKNGALQRAYSVSAIPHFFTIDTNGVLQTESVGSGADIRSKLKKLVAQAKDAERKKAMASDQKPAQ